MSTIICAAIIVVALYYIFGLASEQYYLTCPSPDTYVKPFRMSKADTLSLMKRCEKVMPTGKTGDYDGEIDSCMTSCYPGFSFMRKDTRVNLCEKFCKNPKSKECLDCVTSFQCEQTVGNQFPFVCSSGGGSGGVQIKKFSADDIKAYENLMKSI